MISATVILQRLGAAVSRSVLLLTGARGAFSSQAEVATKAITQASTEGVLSAGTVVSAKGSSSALVQGGLATSAEIAPVKASTGVLAKGLLAPAATLSSSTQSASTVKAPLAPTITVKSGYVLEGPQVLVTSTGSAFQTSSGSLLRWDRRNLTGILPPLVNAAGKIASSVAMSVKSLLGFSVNASGSAYADLAASATSAVNIHGAPSAAAELSVKTSGAAFAKGAITPAPVFHVRAVQDGPNLLSTSLGSVFVASTGAALQFQIKTS